MPPLSDRPLRPLVFHILLVLLERDRHGYAIARKIEQDGGGSRIEAATLYRTLRSMMRDGLIREAKHRPDPDLDDERRRYFTVTARGRRAATTEARRLDALLAKARRLDVLEGRTRGP